MTSFSIYHYAGILVTLLAVVLIGVLSAKRVHNAQDFRGDSRQSSAAVVMGTIVGTVIGGSSTIGTTQLAFSYGLSACWFVIGSSVACILLGTVYCRPLYQNTENTASGIIKKEFGPAAGTLSSTINALGMFIALVAQMISAGAVWVIIFPTMTYPKALALTIVLVLAYVVFGGVRGVGLIGIFKLALLYLAVFGGGCLALWKFGGFSGVLHHQAFSVGSFFDPLARGWSTDIGSALSAALGCLGSQTYVQAVRSGRSVSSSRKGALFSALMIPPIGIGATLIGLYMRANHPELAEAKLALPYFLATNMPPLLCGIVMGAILITVIGASAGLTLGISSIISNDFIRVKSDKTDLLLSRVYIALLLLTAAVLSSGSTGSMILDFSFLGLGVRAVSCVVAYTFALFWSGKCRPRVMVAAMVLGPASILLSELLHCPVNSLMVGYMTTLLFLGAAIWLDKCRTSSSHIKR